MSGWGIYIYNTATVFCPAMTI